LIARKYKMELKEIKLTWNLHLVQNKLMNFGEPNHILRFQHPLLNTDVELTKGWRKIRKIFTIGDLYTPKEFSEEIRELKANYQYVEITIKGLKEPPTSVVPEKVDL